MSGAKICKLPRSWIKNLSTSTSMDVLKGWSSKIAENILTRAGGAWSVHKKLFFTMQMEICDQQNTTVIQILAWRTKLAKSTLPEIENRHSQELIHIWNRTQHITDIDPGPSYDSSALPWYFNTDLSNTYKRFSTENFSTTQNLKALEMMIACGDLPRRQTTWSICFVKVQPK